MRAKTSTLLHGLRGVARVARHSPFPFQPLSMAWILLSEGKARVSRSSRGLAKQCARSAVPFARNQYFALNIILSLLPNPFGSLINCSKSPLHRQHVQLKSDYTCIGLL